MRKKILPKSHDEMSLLRMVNRLMRKKKILNCRGIVIPKKEKTYTLSDLF